MRYSYIKPEPAWKYKRIENIIDIYATICKASIACELATFRSKSNRGGKMGLLAYFCSKTTTKVPRMTLKVRSEMTTREV
jgi:hypothetical protein